MKRSKTPSFVAEFPLRTSPSDERELAIRLDATRNVFNACLGESLERLARMRASVEWALARALPKKTKERTKAFQACNDKFGFTQGAIQKYAEACRDACWIGDHIGSHDTQTTSARAFAAVQQYCFNKMGKPRFKGKRQVHSIEGKSVDAVLRLRNGNLCYDGLTIPFIKDPKDKDGWEQQALACKTKFCRVVRRTLRGRDRFYLQLIQEGTPPVKARHKIGSESFATDVGPSTIVHEQKGGVAFPAPNKNDAALAIGIGGRTLTKWLDERDHLPRGRRRGGGAAPLGLTFHLSR